MATPIVFGHVQQTTSEISQVSLSSVQLLINENQSYLVKNGSCIDFYRIVHHN